MTTPSESGHPSPTDGIVHTFLNLPGTEQDRIARSLGLGNDLVKMPRHEANLEMFRRVKERGLIPDLRAALGLPSVETPKREHLRDGCVSYCHAFFPVSSAPKHGRECPNASVRDLAWYALDREISNPQTRWTVVDKVLAVAAQNQHSGAADG